MVTVQNEQQSIYITFLGRSVLPVLEDQNTTINFSFFPVNEAQRGLTNRNDSSTSSQSA